VPKKDLESGVGIRFVPWRSCRCRTSPAIRHKSWGCLDVLAEGSISAADPIQKGGALLRRHFERLLEQIANLLPAFRRHVCATCSSRNAAKAESILFGIEARLHLLRFFPIERVDV